MVAAQRSGWLVTAVEDEAPVATLMPIMWRGDRIVAHMAKANSHWRSIRDGAKGLVIVSGPEAYVSPNWYPSKAEHGKAVPTWNYIAVHLSGSMRLHHDADWLRAAVTELTDVHEGDRPDRWHVTDAPDDFIATMLKSIVGVEMTVERVEAKAKLSQNRSEADQLGVIGGLDTVDDHEASVVAAAMRERFVSG